MHQGIGIELLRSNHDPSPPGLRVAKADRERSQHPLLLIGCFVVVLLAIHPFQDGNGRPSRVLTNLMLLRAGYTHVPYSSLESIVESTKEGYYRALRRTQTTLHPLAKKIIELLPDHETFTLSQLVKLTHGKPSILKLRLEELVGKGYLLPKGQGRGAYHVRKNHA